jgi:hypothetical protein
LNSSVRLGTTVIAAELLASVRSSSTVKQGNKIQSQLSFTHRAQKTGLRERNPVASIQSNQMDVGLCCEHVGCTGGIFDFCRDCEVDTKGGQAKPSYCEHHFTNHVHLMFNGSIVDMF